MLGVTVGLWIPDQGSWVASRGVADLGTGRPMTPDLQAPIGSITKTFTVMIALQLVGESRLSLDDTIDQWYPRITDASLTACLTDCNIHVQRCEEPLTLSSAAPISVNEHGQDIGLGLRNIGIIWGESAT